MDKNNNCKSILLNINANTIPLDKQIELGDMKLIKVDDVFDLYPEIETDFKWTKEDLIEFHNAKLLTGQLIKEQLNFTQDSIESLIKYRKRVQSKEN